MVQCPTTLPEMNFTESVWASLSHEAEESVRDDLKAAWADVYFQCQSRHERLLTWLETPEIE